MSLFHAGDTEAWIPFLGVSQREFDSLQTLVASYHQHCSASGVPLLVVDQSEAVRKQIEQPDTHEGVPVFRIHERLARHVKAPDSKLREIRETLDRLEGGGQIRVVRPELRLFHSQCINTILQEWSQARFVLLLDSDTLFEREGLFGELASAYPEDAWQAITAVGSLVDFSEVTRSLGWKRRVKRLLGLAESQQAERLARRWRLPRLHPFCLLLNRELIVRKQIEFRLLFLDVLEKEWSSDARQSGRMLGDTGSSLVMESARHGLRVGDFPMDRYAGHLRSASYAEDEKSTNVYEWW